VSGANHLPTSRLSGDGPDARFTNPLPVISGRSNADKRPGFAAQTAGIALTILDAPAILAPRS
jgi:hypothetical protein